MFDPQRGTVTTWLLAITRNAAIDAIRYRHEDPMDPDVLLALLSARGQDSVTADVDTSLRLRQALAELPPEQGRAIVQMTFYGLTAREIAAKSGVSICDTLLENGVDIEHACEKQAACTTCHVIVREGFDSLDEASEKEEDMLDKAWGLEATSRLSCQAKVADEDLVIELPKYTINYEREGGAKKP